MFKISVTENKETNCKNCVIINVNYVLFIKSNEHVFFAKSCNIILEALNLHFARYQIRRQHLPLFIRLCLNLLTCPTGLRGV